MVLPQLIRLVNTFQTGSTAVDFVIGWFKLSIRFKDSEIKRTGIIWDLFFLDNNLTVKRKECLSVAKTERESFIEDFSMEKWLFSSLNINTGILNIVAGYLYIQLVDLFTTTITKCPSNTYLSRSYAGRHFGFSEWNACAAWMPTCPLYPVYSKQGFKNSFSKWSHAAKHVVI